MIFPDDILRIIREFSLPYFKYFREYNRALCLHRRRHWPELKRGLIQNPERVLCALATVETSLFRDDDHMDLLDKRGKLHRATQTLLSILQE
jgi:hypothetical protein